MKECTYHFGVPCSAIWLSHILMGLFFIYLGYLIIEGKKVDKWIAISLVVIGVLAALYHSHLWYSENKSNKND
jgi:hypothetical protein